MAHLNTLEPLLNHYLHNPELQTEAQQACPVGVFVVCAMQAYQTAMRFTTYMPFWNWCIQSALAGLSVERLFDSGWPVFKYLALIASQNKPNQA